MSELSAAIDELADIDVRELTDDELAHQIRNFEVSERRLAALKSDRLGELDRREAFKKDGARSASSWLSDQLGVDRRDAGRQVRTANQLEGLQKTSGAFAGGEISPKHAEAIADAMDDDRLREIEGAEDRLLDVARTGEPRHVRREAERLKTVADQDAATERANRQFEKRKAWFSNARADGMVDFHATLHPEGAEYLRVAMDHLNQPEASDVAEEDRRTGPQRDADALVELARRSIDAGELPVKNGQGATVLVRTDRETLEGDNCTHEGCDGHGRKGQGAELSWFGPVPAETARRMTCSGGIARVVFEGESLVLDLGRTTDTASRAQRLALIARDKHCRRCGAPPSWCEAHHIDWWSHGGATDLCNLLLLCRACHQRVHEGGWRIELNPDNSVTFTSKAGREITRPPP